LTLPTNKGIDVAFYVIHASVHKRGRQSNVYPYVCVIVDLWLRLGTVLQPTLVWDCTQKAIGRF